MYDRSLNPASSVAVAFSPITGFQWPNLGGGGESKSPLPTFAVLVQFAFLRGPVNSFTLRQYMLIFDAKSLSLPDSPASLKNPKLGIIVGSTFDNNSTFPLAFSQFAETTSYLLTCLCSLLSTAEGHQDPSWIEHGCLCILQSYVSLHLI